MSKLDETKIIKIFQTQLKNKNFISEDVESFRVGKKLLVSKIDTLVESTDIPPKTELGYFGRKSVVACISDFAAKGIKPLFGIISLTLPKRLSENQVKEIANSFGKVSREFGFKILGGDTNEGKELVIHVCLFGLGQKIIRRRGAKLGDLIFVTGPFGYTSAGLRILLKKTKTNSKFSKKAKDSFLNPCPKIKFGLRCGSYLSSAMDSSDGLALTLNEMARQSKKRFVITRIPSEKDLFEFSKENNLNPLKLVFEGGEEYEFVFTVSAKNQSKVLKIATLTKTPLIEIGYVMSGNGVVLRKGEKTSPISDKGWKHF